MTRAIVFTTLFFLAVSASIIGFYNYPQIKLTAQKVKAECLPGEKLDFKLVLSNKGMKNNYFLINVKSDMKNQAHAPAVVFLPSKTLKEIDYSMDIPAKTAPGEYRIEITASLPPKTSFPFKKLSSENLFVTVKEQPPLPVMKKAEPVTGKTRFTQLPDNFKYNTLYQLRTSFFNTSGLAAGFIVSLNISGPDRNTWVSSRTITLSPGETSEAEFQFSAGESFTAGDYLLDLGLFDKKTLRQLSGDSQVISLVDNQPEIELNTMYDKKEKKFDFVCKAADDRAIRGINLYFSDLSSGYTTNYPMQLVSGSNRSGIWAYSVNLNKRIGKSRFYAAAADSGSQYKQTDTYSVSSYMDK
ncbi:MAG: hypothetical protein A2297_03165 [Elusimicrobia bacterium RIFOXYB2_FULL_48_7]|nr:MAG: hypothetical protein A2297_03165 [Elusimicrobia bacterium RIFOXYB2_FULL_48_7]